MILTAAWHVMGAVLLVPAEAVEQERRGAICAREVHGAKIGKNKITLSVRFVVIMTSTRETN